MTLMSYIQQKGQDFESLKNSSYDTLALDSCTFSSLEQRKICLISLAKGALRLCSFPPVFTVLAVGCLVYALLSRCVSPAESTIALCAAFQATLWATVLPVASVGSMICDLFGAVFHPQIGKAFDSCVYTSAEQYIAVFKA